MKLPKFFRKFTPISAILVGVAMVLRMFLYTDPPNLLSTISEIIFFLSLFAFFTSLFGLLVVRSLENALIRRFGESATATVLAVATTNKSVNRVGVYRVKLEVHPPNGESFINVAEDVIRISHLMRAGDTVPVKYDPYTRETALILPKKIKLKGEDF